MWALRAPRDLAALPTELLFLICAYLEAEDLAALSQTCRRLRDQAFDDRHWFHLVKRSLPFCHITSAWPAASFRDLYILHDPLWFIPRSKIWFGDEAHLGRILIARYDPGSGAIEAFRLVAERGAYVYRRWEHDSNVLIHVFEPRIGLHMENPPIRLEPTRPTYRRDAEPGESRLQPEISMTTTTATKNGVFSNLILARHVCAEQDPSFLWPPVTIPSPQRTSIPDRLREDKRPTSRGQINRMTFRLRKWMEFVHMLQPVNVRMGDQISTYSTLMPQLYSPTWAAPWRGIWIGDYPGHGCEFLLMMQPDDELALPPPSKPDLARGSLIAVKLTGDPNVPRGEVSFMADDLGPNGLIRVAAERDFRGARIVKCRGHIANPGFRDEQFIDSELILISTDRIAHYWRDLGFISFYQRISIDDMVRKAQTRTAAKPAASGTN